MQLGLIAALHLAALGLMYWYEAGIVASSVYLLTWGLLNFFWLALLRRPAVSAALSLTVIVVVTLLSQLAVPLECRRAGLRVRPFADPAPRRTIALA